MSYIFLYLLLIKSMLIKLEQSFLNTLNQLNEPFSKAEQNKLAFLIESLYENIITSIKKQENNKTTKPQLIELGDIGSRHFTLSLYYIENPENDDIPLSITKILPTISSVRADIMAGLQTNQVNGENNSTNYLKAGQLYDDGDINCRYVNEIIQEEETGV